MPANQLFHQQPTWIKEAIECGHPLHYSRSNGLVHNILNCGLLAALVVVAIAICVAGAQFASAAFIPFGAFGFGLIYFSLFILVVHEASHNMFLNLGTAGRSRQWNRRLGWMVCIPFGVEYVKHWEIGHRIHHRDPVEPYDPQNCPETLYCGPTLLVYLAKVLFVPGYAIFRLGATCPAERYDRNWPLTMASILIWVCTLTVQSVFFHWTVAIAALLGLHVLVALNAIKIAMEHGGAVGRRENVLMRSCSSFFPLRHLFMPFNISLHFEHHLNCSVPWYHLMQYHKVVEAIAPADLHSDIFKLNTSVWQHIRCR